MQAKQLLLSLSLCCAATAQAQMHSERPTSDAQALQQSSLSFIENKGQITDQHGNPRHDISFRIGGSGLNLFTSSGQLHYQWAAPAAEPDSDGNQRFALYRMDVTLVGANPQAKPVAEQKQPFYERYYTPQFGEQGATAYAYQKITYKEVYPHIDWVLYVKGDQVEYDFVVRPGGKVSDIKLKYSGATRLAIDPEGRLSATTPMGTVSERAPVSFQGDGKPVASRFLLQGDVLSFSTAPHSGTLTIDPTLSWSTYYGGSGMEVTKSGCVATDKWGNGFLCGYTPSPNNIATAGSFKDTFTAQNDAFLVKFNSSGVRIWATYYGGTTQDYGWGTATDSSGNVYMAGYSNGNGLSTGTSHQPVKSGGYDAFLVKFDTAGARLWATYYGGSASEQGYAVACDRSENVYLAGYTNNSASGIATTGSYQPIGGGSNDAFLAKFNSAGVRQWATYYGGSSVDQGISLACDTMNNVFLAGYTLSTSGIASASAHQSVAGGNEDGFLVKFDSTGNRLWGTYYGGAGMDMCQGVACDLNGNPFIVGYTVSTTAIATTGSHQPVFGGGGGADAYLVKFNSAGVRQWGTYYGDDGDDWGLALTTDRFGNAFITGFTSSDSAIATVGGVKDSLDVQDAFIGKFDTAGNRVWGTYIGGDFGDMGYGISCDPNSRLYLGGMTSSAINLATPGAHQTTSGGGSRDAFLALINDCDLIPPPGINGPDTICSNGSYTYTVTAMPGAISYTWTLPAGWSGMSAANSINVTAGNASDTVRVQANYVCGSSGEAAKYVVIIPVPAITPSGTVGICYGDSVTLTTPAAVSYQWLNSSNVIAGAVTANYTASSAGYYRVITSNVYGCTDTSSADTVIVHPLPVPVITASGNTLTTGGYISYQWEYNGTAITGATSNSYTATVTTGIYTVIVTDTNGCAGTSAPFDASTLNIRDVKGLDNMVIYPNPATRILHIDASVPVNATLFATDGRVVGKYRNAKEIDLTPLPDGIYLIRLTDAAGNLQRIKTISKHANR